MKNKKIYIIGFLVILFIVNTILVVTGSYDAVDTFMRNFIIRYSSEITSKFMHFITFFGSTKFIILASCVIFFIYLFKKKKGYAFSAASIIIISTVINNVIKLIIARPRPEYISVIEHSYSYPSGHTMAATTLYGFLIYLLIKGNVSNKYKIIYSCILGLLIIMVGISRIYLGAHFFSDVFGGMILSTTILLIFDLINEKKNLLK
ncbi:MAG: phosphatase PAP2 family protein [Bacilli bacterium]|nr:phosphatase PAP2 family protein [Bacilli bacterium]